MKRAELQSVGELSLGQALVLGLLHGPAELLPISSSGHVTLVPWLLGWEFEGLDAELRKSFEVALHAGTAAALLITLREEIRDTVGAGDPRLALLICLSFIPPAAAGYLLEGPIERHLGRPGPVAAGLVAGSVVMWAAERSPGRRGRPDATAADALWLGAAQAAALMPGVSRNGATVAAARRRGFSPEEANLLSRQVALPIIAAATARRLFRNPMSVAAGDRGGLLTGAVASFISTLGSTWIIGRVERKPSLLPYVLYRLGLAGLVGGRSIAAWRGRQSHRSER
jgi:undecaprenyl-diphosphatase